MIDPIDQAGYDLVHSFRGGATRLAPLVNMNAGTLCNKANPGMESHNLTVKEAVTIQNTRKRYDILFAEAMALNHVCIPLGDFSQVSDVELLETYTRYHTEIGETAAEINTTLRDGRISREQVERVRKEFFEDVQAGLAFIQRLEGLIDEQT